MKIYHSSLILNKIAFTIFVFRALIEYINRKSIRVLKMQENLDQVDLDQTTAFHQRLLSTYYPESEIFEFFQENKGDIDLNALYEEESFATMDVIYLALRGGYFEFAEFLLRDYDNGFVPSLSPSYSALNAASMFHKIAIIELLLDRGLWRNNSDNSEMREIKIQDTLKFAIYNLSCTEILNIYFKYIDCSLITQDYIIGCLKYIDHTRDTVLKKDQAEIALLIAQKASKFIVKDQTMHLAIKLSNVELVEVLLTHDYKDNPAKPILFDLIQILRQESKVGGDVVAIMEIIKLFFNSEKIYKNIVNDKNLLPTMELLKLGADGISIVLKIIEENPYALGVDFTEIIVPHLHDQEFEFKIKGQNFREYLIHYLKTEGVVASLGITKKEVAILVDFIYPIDSEEKAEIYNDWARESPNCFGEVFDINRIEKILNFEQMLAERFVTGKHISSQNDLAHEYKKLLTQQPESPAELKKSLEEIFGITFKAYLPYHRIEDHLIELVQNHPKQSEERLMQLAIEHNLQRFFVYLLEQDLLLEDLEACAQLLVESEGIFFPATILRHKPELLENISLKLDSTQKPMNIMEFASWHGRIDLIELFLSYDIGFSDYARDLAISRGYIHIIEYTADSLKNSDLTRDQNTQLTLAVLEENTKIFSNLLLGDNQPEDND